MEVISLLHFLRTPYCSYDASVSLLPVGSDLFPRWFRE